MRFAIENPTLNGRIRRSSTGKKARERFDIEKDREGYGGVLLASLRRGEQSLRGNSMVSECYTVNVNSEANLFTAERFASTLNQPSKVTY